MSLYQALVALGLSAVHYSRSYNASSGVETTSYGQDPPGGPVALLQPLFVRSHPAPPVDFAAVRNHDLRFFADTDALLDTPSMEVFYDVLATFPNARVVITGREPFEWATSRRARHPSDRVPMLHALGIDAPMHAVSEAQAAMALALWHRAVSASVPPERLLILDLFTMPSDELWHRLCAFLGRPLPRADASGSLPPFPHERYGDDVKRWMAMSVSAAGSTAQAS